MINPEEIKEGARKIEKMRKTRDYIMENFDFKKVHKIMLMLDWKWVQPGKGIDSMRIPDVDELYDHARSMLNDIVHKGYIQVRSGGFEASLNDEEGEQVLSLKFIVEDCGNYI